MKYIAALCASFLLALSVSVLPTVSESKIYDDVLRFHVVAKSDSDEDQRLKLAVRDSVLEYIAERLDGCTELAEACATLEDCLDEIKENAEKCISDNGQCDKVEVYLGKEKYPRRIYGSAVMPEGEYTSLRIVIGEGEGHNWWCILFPTLCTGFSYAEDSIPVGFTPMEYKLINGKGRYRVKLRLLEILENIFENASEK